MQYSIALLGALAVLPAANCVAFGGPAPTVSSPNRVLDVSNPRPTKGPSIAELRRRQSNLFPETCGWQSGDLSSSVTCKFGNTCMMYTASGSGMIGCCESSNLQSCGWVNSCVDYDAITSGSCNGDCKANSFVLKCSALASPYCVSWTYPSNNIKDYGCGTDPFSIYETVFQEASEFLYSTSTSISLPTVSGNAVTGWDSTGGAGGKGTKTGSGLSDPTELPSGGGKKSKKTRSKISLGMVIGIAAGALLLFIIVAGIIIICCVKQKKKRQALANQQAIAAAQASRPQSQYNSQMPQQQMQQVPPPMPQTPNPGMDGYYKPAIDTQSPYAQHAEPQKYNPQTQVHEYSVQSPISNPPTPAPAYSQPYQAPNNGQIVPPMPTQSPAPYQMREPTPGAHEVDAISLPQAPQGQQGQREPVYEIGNGR